MEGSDVRRNAATPMKCCSRNAVWIEGMKTRLKGSAAMIAATVTLVALSACGRDSY
jgi:hypothetical protein